MTNLNRAFAVRPVGAAWLLAVAIDLFFNAGVFRWLFDQGRELNLLPDDVLFRRIPVAYLVLLTGVTGLAWLIDRVTPGDILHGLVVGAVVGALFALMGIVYLWTAIDMTGRFVAAGSLVGVVQFSTSGGVLTAFRTTNRSGSLIRRILGSALGLAIVAVVIQNLAD
jgi:hypothetical protein